MKILVKCDPIIHLRSQSIRQQFQRRLDQRSRIRLRVAPIGRLGRPGDAEPDAATLIKAALKLLADRL